MYQSLFTEQNQNQQNQVGLRLVDWLEEVDKESMPWVRSAIGNVLTGPPHFQHQKEYWLSANQATVP